MTLLFAAGNTEQFIQVTDRLLTVDGAAAGDDSNKAMVIDCENARLAVGFTGLARYAQFETRSWLISTLKQCGAPDYMAGGLLKRFREQATKDFRNLPLLRNLASEHKRLTILFTGYLYDRDPALAVLALVSNFQNIDRGFESAHAWDHFKCFFREEARPNSGRIALFSWAGGLPRFREGDSTKLRELVRERQSSETIIQNMVRIFGGFAEDPKSRNRVGGEFSSIVVPRDRSLAAVSRFHPGQGRTEYDSPDRISVRKDGVETAQVDSHSPSFDPKPSQLCWCGSGKKYKRCHRLKRKKAMPDGVGMAAETPW